MGNNNPAEMGRIKSAMTIVALSVGLLMEKFPGPQFQSLGDAPEEKAALFMKEHLDPGARIGSSEPGIVWTIKMTFVPIVGECRNRPPDQDLSDWMIGQNLQAIYVDNALRDFEPTLFAWLQEQIGKSLEVVFASDEGNVQVLLTKTTR